MKLLSQHDLEEVELFRQYLGDLHSDMPAPKFAEKWHAYIGTDNMAAEAYHRAKLVPMVPNAALQESSQSVVE